MNSKKDTAQQAEQNKFNRLPKYSLLGAFMRLDTDNSGTVTDDEYKKGRAEVRSTNIDNLIYSIKSLAQSPLAPEDIKEQQIAYVKSEGRALLGFLQDKESLKQSTVIDVTELDFAVPIITRTGMMEPMKAQIGVLRQMASDFHQDSQTILKDLESGRLQAPPANVVNKKDHKETAR